MKTPRRKLWLWACTWAIAWIGLIQPGITEARVRLITMPPRERVEVQLDHADATLVEEERIVPLTEGVNQIDFVWAGTKIDPGTIVFRVLGSADEDVEMNVNVLSVSYPPGENALVWHVNSDQAGSAVVRISYLLGGLDKSFNYRAVAEQDESTLTLSQYVRVRNLAGEAFGDTDIYVGVGDVLNRPIGTQETREMLVERYEEVPIQKTFTANFAEFGYIDEPQRQLRIPMHYVLTNDADNNLGRSPLPYGKARIFQKDGGGSTAFLGEDWGQFTPVDDEMKLYLGVARDVVVRRRILSRETDRVAGNLAHYDVVVQYEIENFRDQPTQLNVIEQINHVRNEANIPSNWAPEWVVGQQTTFANNPDEDLTNHEEVGFVVDLPPREGDEAETITHTLHLQYRNERFTQGGLR
ncbi:MAG: hypothetical protein WD294_10945 [Phycisphaeraceae bacterium]